MQQANRRPGTTDTASTVPPPRRAGADVRVLVAALTDVGATRSENEDRFLVADALAARSLIVPFTCSHTLASAPILMAVSDGMGGENAGEVASAMTLDVLLRWVGQNLQRCLPIGALRLAIERAHEEVTFAAARPDRTGMGATVVAALLDGGLVHLAAVGDSRAYLRRSGKLVQVTHDQSFVQQLVDHGALAREQIPDFPYKNVLIQAVGRAPNLQVACGSIELRRGDQLVLCSDGLTTELSDSDILSILGNGARSLDAVCRELVAAANQHGGNDNITVVLAAFEGDDLPPADPHEDISRLAQSIASPA
ncbi:MAG TPA: protein phosphatase 2C domain-containing protein [Polyangiaceae bacterium]|nr:protein phosphatase 2C domain-containing protein [Polyangiaceae bacterium]